MLDPSRHNQEFPFLNPNAFVSKLHTKSSLHDEEEFVFGVVLVPDKLSLKFDDFDLLTIEFPYDFGTPVVKKKVKFLAQVDFIGVQEAIST